MKNSGDQDNKNMSPDSIDLNIIKEIDKYDDPEAMRRLLGRLGIKRQATNRER